MQPDQKCAPLYCVVGAAGVGKTTLLPVLVRLAQGIVVIDQDELFENGALLGRPITDPEAGAPFWPAYDRMWERIIHMIRRAGHPVVLLCVSPSVDDPVPDEDADGPIHWSLLDCADELRLARLRARAWPSWQIEDAMSDAAHSRAAFASVIRTDGADTEQTARQVLAWASNVSATGSSGPEQSA